MKIATRGDPRDWLARKKEGFVCVESRELIVSVYPPQLPLR